MLIVADATGAVIPLVSNAKNERKHAYKPPLPCPYQTETAVESLVLVAAVLVPDEASLTVAQLEQFVHNAPIRPSVVAASIIGIKRPPLAYNKLSH